MDSPIPNEALERCIEAPSQTLTYVLLGPRSEAF